MRSLVRRALAAACAATLATLATAAHASPSAKLVYVRGAGAETCPGEAELRKAVAARIGYDPFFPTAQKTVIAQVSRVAAGYRGRMALAVSIALDDLDEAPATPTNPAPAPPPPPAPAPPAPVADLVRPVEAARPGDAAPPAPPPPVSPPGPRVELGASALAWDRPRPGGRRERRGEARLRARRAAPRAAW